MNLSISVCVGPLLCLEKPDTVVLIPTQLASEQFENQKN